MKNALNQYKNNNGPNFNTQNSQLPTLSSATKEIFQVHGQKRPVVNIPVVDFHSQPREIPV